MKFSFHGLRCFPLNAFAIAPAPGVRYVGYVALAQPQARPLPADAVTDFASLFPPSYSASIRCIMLGRPGPPECVSGGPDCLLAAGWPIAMTCCRRKADHRGREQRNAPVTKSHHITPAVFEELEVAPFVVRNGDPLARVGFDTGRLRRVPAVSRPKFLHCVADADRVGRQGSMRATILLCQNQPPKRGGPPSFKNIALVHIPGEPNPPLTKVPVAALKPIRVPHFNYFGVGPPRDPRDRHRQRPPPFQHCIVVGEIKLRGQRRKSGLLRYFFRLLRRHFFRS